MKNLKILNHRRHLKPTDFIVLFLIVATISVFLNSYSRKKSSFYLEIISKPQDYAAVPIPPPYWIGNSIKVGDSSYDSSGNKVADVVAVQNLDAGGMRRLVVVKLNMFGLIDQINQQYRINDIPLEIGKTLNLTLGNTDFEGVITYVGPSPQDPQYTEKFIQVKLQARSVDPSLIAPINANLDSPAVSTPSSITFHQIEVKPAEKSIGTDVGTLQKTTDPIYKDLLLTVTLPVICHQANCYYRYVYPIKIGGKIDLYDKSISLPDLLITDVLTSDTI